MTTISPAPSLCLSPCQVPSHYHVVAALASLPPSPPPPPLVGGALASWLDRWAPGMKEAHRGCRRLRRFLRVYRAKRLVQRTFCHTQILQCDTAVASCQGKSLIRFCKAPLLPRVELVCRRTRCHKRRKPETAVESFFILSLTEVYSLIKRKNSKGLVNDFW